MFYSILQHRDRDQDRQNDADAELEAARQEADSFSFGPRQDRSNTRGEFAMCDQFYLQDSRTYVGNDVMWWAKGGRGYTTDLSKAHVFSKSEAISHHDSRETDIPWPKEYIDNKTRPAVDMQYIKRGEALAGTGIVLKKSKPRRETHRCEGCGRFLTAEMCYCAPCHNCGTDNRP